MMSSERLDRARQLLERLVAVWASQDWYGKEARALYEALAHECDHDLAARLEGAAMEHEEVAQVLAFEAFKQAAYALGKHTGEMQATDLGPDQASRLQEFQEAVRQYAETAGIAASQQDALRLAFAEGYMDGTAIQALSRSESLPEVPPVASHLGSDGSYQNYFDLSLTLSTQFISMRDHELAEWRDLVKGDLQRMINLFSPTSAEEIAGLSKDDLLRVAIRRAEVAHANEELEARAVDVMRTRVRDALQAGIGLTEALFGIRHDPSLPMWVRATPIEAGQLTKWVEAFPPTQMQTQKRSGVRIRG